jgi:hypothetical protein
LKFFRLSGVILGITLALPASAQNEKTGKQLFESACAACHGVDGHGNPATTVGFSTPLPDFTDCRFVSREPDEDWLAILHEGGPVRSFDRMMPAFGNALTVPELQRILSHVRTFCKDDNWPRGELNLPRPLVTEKAYPEDEAVLTMSANAEGPAAFDQKIIYEKRIGARNQIEIILPFSFLEVSPGKWRGGIGDFALGFKRDLFHSFNKGSIFSAAAEIVLPTGDENRGIGRGDVVFEPYVAFGQLLPASGFLHFQAGFERPSDRTRADEFFWRGAVGKSFLKGGYGRSWSPMVEIVGAKELKATERSLWDVIPQIQVSLSNRQHVLLNAGVRFPLNEYKTRTTQIMVYLLWDWFDGGLFSGW